MHQVPRHFALIATLIAVAGCGPSAEEAMEKETSHLRLLAHYYIRSISDTGRRPKNEQELKDYISKNAQETLQRLGVESVDAVFVSERDGQPFVVLYGPKPQGATVDVVAYEKTGVDGKRQVATSLGPIREVDEAGFRELVPQGG
jgi:hypothetical protein